uniref:Sde2 N-terminal ubiquitin domain-containing protein n=1 Tax=Panagrolaimus davidi TaxID=227884 RepID=A0A914QBR4_9BILA
MSNSNIIYPGRYGGGNQKLIDELRKIDPNFFSIIIGSKYLTLDDIKPSDIFTLKFKLLGGKGGFGSLLRSFRIHKSANQLMCRDLTGRRLADVKEEERLRKWIGKKEERDKAEKRKE